MKDPEKILASVNFLMTSRDEWLSNKNYTDLNRNQFELLMQTKESNLFEECPTIFKQCIEGSMEMDKLHYMLNMMKIVNKNEASYENITKAVGERFAEEYINPLVEKLDKEKEKKN